MGSAKLYVGNLSYGTSEQTVEEAFGAHGEVVSVKLIIDRGTGRPKGFGFVEMGSEAEAQSAVGAMNGAELEGRTLKVEIAKEPAPRTGGADRRGGNYGGGSRW
jgi:RNA recognition motif-containing protein